MRNLIFVLLLNIVFCSSYAQNSMTKSMKEAFLLFEDSVTEVPYESSPNNRSVKSVYCQINEWVQFEVNPWKDWQLTIPAEAKNPMCTLNRRFKSLDESYFIGELKMGFSGSSQGNQYIVVATNNGGHVDHIEAGGYIVTREFGNVYLKQYTITGEMYVVVYHIIPETNRDIAPEGNPPSFKGKRVDTTYKIDSDGKFVKFKEIIYKPATYTLNDLADKEKNIWEGKEEIASTRTF